jgi:hypothetical protein
MDKKALRQKQMDDLMQEKFQTVKDVHINSTVIIDAVEGEIAIQDVRDESVCRFPLEGDFASQEAALAAFHRTVNDIGFQTRYAAALLNLNAALENPETHEAFTAAVARRKVISSFRGHKRDLPPAPEDAPVQVLLAETVGSPEANGTEDFARAWLAKEADRQKL